MTHSDGEQAQSQSPNSQQDEGTDRFYDARTEFSCVAMSRIPLPKMPLFDTKNVDEWFRRLTTQLRLIGAKTEQDNYRCLLSYLGHPWMTEIEESTDPTELQPYTKAKAKLVKKYSISNKQLIEKMMTMVPNKDELPSAFLQNLLRIGGTANQVLARDIWEDHQPDHITTMIHTMAQSSLEEITEAVDEVFKATQRKVVTSPIVKEIEVVAEPAAVFAVQEAILEKLNKMEIFYMQANRQRRPRNENPIPSTSGSTQQSIPILPGIPVERLCYYHKRFAAIARKCDCSKN